MTCRLRVLYFYKIIKLTTHTFTHTFAQRVNTLLIRGQYLLARFSIKDNFLQENLVLSSFMACKNRKKKKYFYSRCYNIIAFINYKLYNG